MSAKYRHSCGRLSRNVLLAPKRLSQPIHLALTKPELKASFSISPAISGLVLKVTSSGTQHFFRRDSYSLLNHFSGINSW